MDIKTSIIIIQLIVISVLLIHYQLNKYRIKYILILLKNIRYFINCLILEIKSNTINIDVAEELDNILNKLDGIFNNFKKTELIESDKEYKSMKIKEQEAIDELTKLNQKMDKKNDDN